MSTNKSIMVGDKNKTMVICLGLVIVALALFSGILFGNPSTAHATEISTIGTPYAYTTAALDLYTDSDLLYNPDAGQAGFTIGNYKASLYKQGITVSQTSSVVTVTATKDDPIVKIVPRQFFEHRGTYLHIGREYGIFVKTERLNDCANVSVVFIFDIIKSPLNNSNYPSQYVIEIRPLFEYKYYYLTENNSFGTGRNDLNYNVSSSLSTVVVAAPEMYYDDYGVYYYFLETTTYFLKDISFGLSLYNEQELNIGDSSYNKNNDNGSFITRAGLNFAGVSNQSLIGDSVWSTIKFGLGFVPYLGEAISIVEWGVDLAKNASTDFRENLEYGNLYNTQYYATKLEQLAHYTNLNKSAIAQLLSDDQKPLLFGRTQENNYARGVFTLGMTEDWYTRVIDTIQLSVVSESTSILGNSTITSRKTAERSSRTNIRTIQAQEVSLEMAKTFYMLPNGVAKLRFNAAYGSNYKISLANSSQMGVKFDGVSTTFSGNVVNKNLSAGSRIIDITGTNSSKLTSTITIEPDTVAATTASKAATIKGSESYLLKITSLSQVKALATGNSNVVVDKIFINNSWTTYSTYGTIAPTSALTHPFTLGNYYVILKNQSTAATSIAFTIAEPATLSINTAKSIAVNSGNYTYVKFTADSTGGKYNITASNSTGLAFTTLKSTGTNLSTVSGDFYPGYFFEIGFDAGNSYYVGIKNTSGATNTLTIKKSTDTLYQWQITGGTLGTVTTSTNTYELTRGYNYSLTLFANGVAVGNGTAIGNAYFGYDNQSTAYGVYSISNPLNNQITINANSPLGGNGIIVTAKMKNSLGQQVSVDTLKIVPKFEEKASITGINNTEDLSFNYSVPKYVYKFEYKIWPNNTVFTANIGASKAVSADTVTGTISFLSNYNSLNYTSVQTMHIDIIKIYYLNAFQQEVGVTKSILGATSFNNLFAGGSGTASSPYLISTLRHFNNIKHFAGSTGNGKYFKQTATLTFSGAHDLHTTSFYGTYDGGGNTITGIRYTINATPQHTDIGGLFGINYGTIKSLNIKKLTINSAVPDHSTESWISVGGVVATNYGLLSSVDVYDGSIITVNRMNSHTGGIVGYNMIVGGLYTTLTVSGTSRNYNVYGCDFGFSSGAESKVYSNGYVGGVVGVNNGNLYSSWAGSYAQVELYQIGANNRAIGGIVGYNNYGYVVSCNNRSTITYKSPKDENKDIAPMMGKIAGLNYGSGNLISSDQGGTLDAGNLITHNGFLGIGSYNQKKYFGAHYDQGIGLNNP